ncbi:hypothetical protein AURDEDRAFT_169014 [Auricularia subglabra TFB-10046 SS5]|nr:hypothetical protein AURDEDRAFT_169014 [Auricularia subglabra TFB-10046 SS5]
MASRDLDAHETRPQPPSYTLPVQLPTHYPWIEESLYPSVYPYNLLCIYPRKEAESIDSVPVASYPFATGIYPAVYPFNLDFIYVPVAHEVEAGPKALLQRISHHPFLFETSLVS